MHSLLHGCVTKQPSDSDFGFIRKASEIEGFVCHRDGPKVSQVADSPVGVFNATRCQMPCQHPTVRPSRHEGMEGRKEGRKEGDTEMSE